MSRRVALFASQNSPMAPCKSGVTTGSKTFGGFIPYDCRTKLRPIVWPKIAAKKGRLKSLSSLFILLHILIPSFATNSRISFACSKPSFLPSSSLIAIKFFYRIWNCLTLNVNITRLLLLPLRNYPKSLIVIFSF